MGKTTSDVKRVLLLRQQTKKGDDTVRSKDTTITSNSGQTKRKTPWEEKTLLLLEQQKIYGEDTVGREDTTLTKTAARKCGRHRDK